MTRLAVWLAVVATGLADVALDEFVFVEYAERLYWAGVALWGHWFFGSERAQGSRIGKQEDNATVK